MASYPVVISIFDLANLLDLTGLELLKMAIDFALLQLILALELLDQALLGFILTFF